MHNYNCQTYKPFGGRQDVVKMVDNISMYHMSFPEHHTKINEIMEI